MFRALSISYIGLSLEEAFTLQNEFNLWRSSGQLSIDIKQNVSSWYCGNQNWLPGIRQSYNYFSLYSRHRKNTNNKGHFSIHEFYNKFPASIIFCDTCHIKYQYQMFWEMSEDHQKEYGSKWTEPSKFFQNRSHH